MTRQPWLHELAVTVLGNVTALSLRSGDIRPDGAQGLFVDDRRVISALELTVDGDEPAYVGHGALASEAEFLGCARNLGATTPDPVVEVRRRRRLVPGGMVETITVTSRAADGLSGDLAVRLSGDQAPIAAVKSGVVRAPAVEPQLGPDRVRFHGDWLDVVVRFDPPPVRTDASDGGERGVDAHFDLVLPPGGSTSLHVVVETRRLRRSPLDADPGGSLVDWSHVRVVGKDPRLDAAISCSLADLQALLLADPLDPQDAFGAAGSPWYLTLFGRDSIWAARLTLPLGTELAGGTLRALGRRQGRRTDPESGEAPGKIPHEVRRSVFDDPSGGMTLPALYYGTVDATALWVVLLREAWEWGLAEDAVRALFPVLDAAVEWLLGEAIPDDEGLLKYLDESGHGLSNQGWKDSDDAIRFRDGRVAEAPLALIEAQAYAVQALDSAAQLADLFGRAGAGRLRKQADELRERVRSRYWTTDPLGRAGRYPGVAVDRAGRLVDGLASNMGHVLGTGVLGAAEAAVVAGVLTGPELLDRYGVRTLGSGNGGFNPIGYHTGSIWTHDTAIAALGLAAEGFRAEAVTVATTLLAAAEAFDYRLPELYSGEPIMGRPAPYPASCRPQAWSAASAVALLTVALGLQPERATRTLHVRPVAPAAYGAMRVEGLRFLGGVVDLDVADDGSVTVVTAPADVTVRVHDPVLVAPGPATA